MSTAQPNDAQGVVSITRDQRDALHHEIRNYALSEGSLGDLHLCLEWSGRGAEARERWQRMELVARLLDDLGWDRQADRDVYALTIDVSILERWARQRLEDTEASLTDHARTLAEVRAGRDPWASYGRLGPGEISLEEELDVTRSLADRDLELVGACRAILAQVGTR